MSDAPGAEITPPTDAAWARVCLEDELLGESRGFGAEEAARLTEDLPEGVATAALRERLTRPRSALSTRVRKHIDGLSCRYKEALEATVGGATPYHRWLRKDLGRGGVPSWDRLTVTQAELLREIDRAAAEGRPSEPPEELIRIDADLAPVWCLVDAIEDFRTKYPPLAELPWIRQRLLELARAGIRLPDRSYVQWGLAGRGIATGGWVPIVGVEIEGVTHRIRWSPSRKEMRRRLERAACETLRDEFTRETGSAAPDHVEKIDGRTPYGRWLHARHVPPRIEAILDRIHPPKTRSWQLSGRSSEQIRRDVSLWVPTRLGSESPAVLARRR